MMARSTTRSNQKPDTLMQDRISQSCRNLLRRTAGPYIRVKTRLLLGYRYVSFRRLRTCRLLGLPGLFANFTYDDVRNLVLDPVVAEIRNSPDPFRSSRGHNAVIFSHRKSDADAALTFNPSRDHGTVCVRPDIEFDPLPCKSRLCLAECA